MTSSYGTQVETATFLQSMFNIHRSVTETDVGYDTALSYIKHIGCFYVDLENPQLILTYFVREKNAYVAICNNHESEDTVTAILLNEQGEVENFLAAAGDNDFSHINLFYLNEAFDLEDIPRFSNISLSELQKKLNDDYVKIQNFFEHNLS